MSRFGMVFSAEKIGKSTRGLDNQQCWVITHMISFQCLSFYWVCSSLFGLSTNIILRLPRVQRALRLRGMSKEDETPFRSLFNNAKEIYNLKSITRRTKFKWESAANITQEKKEVYIRSSLKLPKIFYFNAHELWRPFKESAMSQVLPISWTNWTVLSIVLLCRAWNNIANRFGAGGLHTFTEFFFQAKCICLKK